jgi:hypothetical protein
MFTSVVMCLFALSVIAGCGGGGEEDTSGTMKPTASGSDKKTSDADSDEKDSDSDDSAVAEGIGSVSGTIKVTGDVPELPPLVKKGDPEAKDAEVCAAEAVPNETLVVGEGNGVANVFVWLRKAPDGAPQVETPTEPILYDQKGCQFVPHAVVVQTSQPVKVVSSDAVPHNVHTYPVKNSAVNQIIPPNDKSGLMVEYSDAEITPVRVKCDIHPWMLGWHFPIDHPYVALTDANGNFKIENLPAGTHELRIWHEMDGDGGYLEKAYEVTVKADEDTEVNLEYSVSDFGH